MELCVTYGLTSHPQKLRSPNILSMRDFVEGCAAVPTIFSNLLQTSRDECDKCGPEEPTVHEIRQVNFAASPLSIRIAKPPQVGRVPPECVGKNNDQSASRSTRLCIWLCDVDIVAMELCLDAADWPVMIVAPIAVYARHTGGFVSIKPGKVLGEIGATSSRQRRSDL